MFLTSLQKIMRSAGQGTSETWKKMGEDFQKLFDSSLDRNGGQLPLGLPLPDGFLRSRVGDDMGNMAEKLVRFILSALGPLHMVLMGAWILSEFVSDFMIVLLL